MNNLFQHATSELSQDAILAWLISWADNKYATCYPQLHQTGRHFIAQLFTKAGKQVPAYTTVKTHPQWNKIDLLVKLDNHAILIEDKVYANAHGEQLKKYRQILQQTYNPENILSIFLKTGYQPDFTTVKEDGFHPFTAEDLMEVVKYGKNNAQVKNDIFAEFHTHLGILVQEFKEAKNAYEQFRNIPVKQWKYWHWQGFMHHMKTVMPDALVVNNQFRREHMLSFIFGFHAFEQTAPDGQKIKFEPNFDLALSNNKPYLSTRMWIQHMPKQHVKPIREALIHRLENAQLGKRGKYKSANNSILLTRLPLDINDMTAEDLQQHLEGLQFRLRSIDTSAIPL